MNSQEDDVILKTTEDLMKQLIESFEKEKKEV